jgi:hypothetical protein
MLHGISLVKKNNCICFNFKLLPQIRVDIKLSREAFVLDSSHKTHNTVFKFEQLAG